MLVLQKQDCLEKIAGEVVFEAHAAGANGSKLFLWESFFNSAPLL